METKNLTARPSTLPASALSLTPTVVAPWSMPLAASALTCGHAHRARKISASAESVGLFAGPLAGALATGVGSEGSGATAGIGGNGRSYAIARLIPAMSEVVSVKPATARQRRDVDVPGGIPPRGRPD